QAPGITDFTTTITATGGGDSDSRTFIWHVLSGSSPIVLFAVNNTLRTDDDVTLMGLPLDVRVTLYAPGSPFPQTVSLTVSGPWSLNMSTLPLMDGMSATVTLTPTGVSQQEDDVQLLAFVGGMPGQPVGQAKETNMGPITIKTGTNVNKIRAAN